MTNSKFLFRVSDCLQLSAAGVTQILQSSAASQDVTITHLYLFHLVIGLCMFYTGKSPNRLVHLKWPVHVQIFMCNRLAVVWFGSGLGPF